MRELTEDELDDLEFSEVPSEVKAATILGWLDDPQVTVAPELTLAHLLVVAAQHLELAGALDEALAVARRARDAADSAPLEAHPTMVSVLLAMNDRDAAITLADEVRAGSFGVDVAQELAETFELHDELALAERWFVIGVRLTPEDDLENRAMLLRGRYRVRRDAGKPSDVLDAETEQLLARLGRTAP